MVTFKNASDKATYIYLNGEYVGSFFREYRRTTAWGAKAGYDYEGSVQINGQRVTVRALTKALIKQRASALLAA